MSAAKDKGTKWESAIVQFLRCNGVPHAERRTLGGVNDRGDIAGIPGVAIEAKSAARAELASWLDEAETERVNDGADIGVVWFKRRGRPSPGAGFVLMHGDALVALLTAAGYIAPQAGYIAPQPSTLPAPLQAPSTAASGDAGPVNARLLTDRLSDLITDIRRTYGIAADPGAQPHVARPIDLDFGIR